MEIIAQICVSGLFIILAAIVWTAVDVIFDENVFLSVFVRVSSTLIISFYLANFVLPNFV